MQIVQKIYIECQEMMPDMKIKKGNFWFNGEKYNILNGSIIPEKTIKKEMLEPIIEEIQAQNKTIPF